MHCRRPIVSVLLLVALVAASPAAAVVDLDSLKGFRQLAEGEEAEPGLIVLKLGAIELVSFDYKELPGGGDGAGGDVDLDDGVLYTGGDGGSGGFTGAVPEPGAALVFSLGALVVGARVSRRRSA